MTDDVLADTASADAGEPGSAGAASLPRRAFVMTALMAGFTPAVAHAAAAPIHTDAAGLVAEEVRVPVPDGTLPGYMARPAGAGPFPVVLVIEEIFGVHEYIKDVCRRLAHAGFLAVAPELYARLADLSGMTDPQQIIRDVISKAPDATVLGDLDATARWAGTQNGDLSRLGVIGFCRGGRDSWLYATHNPHLRAAVAFYGPVRTPDTTIQPHSPLDLAGTLKCPLLGLYGGQDTSIAVDDVQAARKKARDAGQEVEIVVYPDAPHGFHADYRPSYHPADAVAAWNRALEWFHRHGL
jgi:carboxymethylenebutenolidase